jgi:hypothetical protein
MLTTAGVTFFTISEKPCAMDGGTPAATAVEPVGKVLHATATTHRKTNAMIAFFSRLHMTAFLQQNRWHGSEAERCILHHPFQALQRLKVPSRLMSKPEEDEVFPTRLVSPR